MSLITKLIELYLVSRTLSTSRAQVEKLMGGMASILFLAAIMSILGIMAMACIYGMAYVAMSASGLTPLASLFALLAATIIVLVVVLLIMRDRWRNLSAASHGMFNSQSPLGGAGGKIFEAFLAGFEGRNP